MALHPCDQDRLHCRRGLKIRSAPSCKISADPSSSSSFHGRCSHKNCTTVVSLPLIFHHFDPEIILTEPAEFMSVVQRLTGSPQTRRLLRASMRKRKEMELSSVSQVCTIPDAEFTVQQDPLKEGRTIILAPTKCSSRSNAGGLTTNDSPASRHTSPNPSELSKSNSQLSTATPVSSETKQINLNTNHPPSSCIFPANSANSEEDTIRQPESPSDSPPSPHSSLTTTSSEAGYLTDNPSIDIEECGASSYRETLSCLEQANTLNIEEDGSINFFVFSRDSYYGNSYPDHVAHDDQLDQFLNFNNALDPFLSV